MRRRQSRLGYRNILRIADGYVPTVGEKSGNYATIHNSNGAERNSRRVTTVYSIGRFGYDLAHHPISRWNFIFPLVPLTHTVAHRQFGADGVLQCWVGMCALEISAAFYSADKLNNINKYILQQCRVQHTRPQLDQYAVSCTVVVIQNTLFSNERRHDNNWRNGNALIFA